MQYVCQAYVRGRATRCTRTDTPATRPSRTRRRLLDVRDPLVLRRRFSSVTTTGLCAGFAATCGAFYHLRRMTEVMEAVFGDIEGLTGRPRRRRPSGVAGLAQLTALDPSSSTPSPPTIAPPGSCSSKRRPPGWSRWRSPRRRPITDPDATSSGGGADDLRSPRRRRRPTPVPPSYPLGTPTKHVHRNPPHHPRPIAPPTHHPDRRPSPPAFPANAFPGAPKRIRLSGERNGWCGKPGGAA